MTQNSRKARFYEITRTGRKHLAAEKREWDRMVTIMHAVLREEH